LIDRITFEKNQASEIAIRLRKLEEVIDSQQKALDDATIEREEYDAATAKLKEELEDAQESLTSANAATSEKKDLVDQARKEVERVQKKLESFSKSISLKVCLFFIFLLFFC
jgi:methyl-accepting chemotaxis protein